MDVNVKDAWQYCTGDPSIIVAVIDDGVNYTHEDLAANMWVNTGEIADNGIDDDNNGYIDDVHGYNHCTGGKISWDDDHGTNVAGTVAAVNNNGKGVCGVAGGNGSGNGVKIMSSQLFSGNIKGNSEISARAFKYAADNGAVIAQCSWGYNANPNGMPAITSDLEYKRSAGAEYDGILYFQSVKNSDVLDGGLVIFASGNDDIGQSGYPGGYRDFISVAATGCDGMPTYYTNYGPGVNISAPGGNMKDHGNAGGILSTLTNNRYGYMQGTSMACPHAVGMAALALSYAMDNNLSFSVAEFKTIFLSSVNDLNSKLTGQREYYAGWMNLDNYKKKMGTGSLDAFLLLMNIRGEICLPAVVGEEVEIVIGDYLSTGEAQLKLLREIEMSDDDKTRLGVTTLDIFNGMLCIKCSKPGVARIKLFFVAGGDKVGGGDNIGGMRIEKEFAIIARPGNTNSGWM
jgi:hypothetical protein